MVKWGRLQYVSVVQLAPLGILPVVQWIEREPSKL